MGTLDCNYGISRLDQPASGTHGWQVRMQRQGVKYGKYFPDRSYGGPEAALEGARTWRDEVLARLTPAEQMRVWKNSARNSSGVIGVSRVIVSSGNGVVYHFWQATWCPAPGERRCVRFSVKRHGDRTAFRLAVKARQDGTRG